MPYKLQESANQARRELKARRREEKSCLDCGDARDTEFVRCEECLANRRLRNKQKTAKPSTAIYQKEWKRQLKAEVIAAYGNKCACCTLADVRFLSIDHIANDGANHRRKNKLTAGTSTYAWLRKNNYPAGFQVLCFNCNFAKQLNEGVCPHQQGKTVKNLTITTSLPKLSEFLQTAPYMS